MLADAILNGRRRRRSLLGTLSAVCGGGGWWSRGVAVVEGYGLTGELLRGGLPVTAQKPSKRGSHDDPKRLQYYAYLLSA